MTTDELVKISKNYFIKVASTAAKTAVFTYVPFLKLPFFSTITNKAIDWLIGKVADTLELGAFFIYVDFRVDAQGKDYVLAAHEAEKLQTEEARKKADEAFKKFAHFNSL